MADGWRHSRYVPARWRRISRDDARKDLGAGVVLGLESVPDGLAAGLLAGVNPVFGLYAYLVGTFVGATATSSAFMTVQATGAMAVLITDVPSVHSGPDAATALFTLSVLTGIIMLTAGLLRWGSLVRFVPHAVLTGFISAVAVNIVLGQLANVTGYVGVGANRILRAIDTLLHAGLFDISTVVIAVVTVALILALERTRLGPLGLVVAMVVASAIVPVLQWDSVAILRDIATIPSGLPHPTLPSLSLVPALVVPALSLAFVGLVQGAAISSSIPNPDGRYPDPSGDFRGQGVANIAAGLLQGMPVGGSMSATSLARNAGARTRLTNLIAGVVMAIVILLFGGVAELIAMPALGGLLIIIGVRTFKVDRVRMVWRTGATQAAVMLTTFALTLVLPLQYAVLAGVGISVILYVAQQSNRVTVVRWRFTPGSLLPHEEPAPAEVESSEVVVLVLYGSVFFASATVIEAQLPMPASGCRDAVVILRLRGKEDLGSTFIQALLRYNATLRDSNCRLLLAGMDARAMRQLTDTGALADLGPANVFPATSRVGDSLTAALARASELTGGGAS